MAAVIEGLLDQLSGDTTRQISQRLGTDTGTTQQAIAAALPVLIGALAKNSSRGDGAASLAGALDRDHDGSVLDDIGGFLQGAGSGPGEGILGHVLGGVRPTVERRLGQKTGLDPARMAQLLAMLAPIVMGALGRMKRSEGLDADGLARQLAAERKQAAKGAPVSLDAFTGLLDSDADGDVGNDLARAGGGLLGRLFKRSR